MGGTTDGTVEPEKYPSERSQILFCRTYLEQVASQSARSEPPTDEEVSALVVEANLYGLLSHLYWSLWGIAQSVTSEVDFDYLLFARNRFLLYMQTRDKYLPETAG